jgi:hypothetical protein
LTIEIEITISSKLSINPFSNYSIMSEKGTISVHTENIFPIIKKFLYSDHEIFLRELVSNAVDATQKLKTLASMGEMKGELGETKIVVKLDKDNKTLHIIDRGIGLTEEEVKKYINQVALSSAEEFLEKYKDNANQIIGHFGFVRKIPAGFNRTHEKQSVFNRLSPFSGSRCIEEEPTSWCPSFFIISVYKSSM